VRLTPYLEYWFGHPAPLFFFLIPFFPQLIEALSLPSQVATGDLFLHLSSFSKLSVEVSSKVCSSIPLFYFKMHDRFSLDLKNFPWGLG
jgi:hypothetical protein